MLTDLLAECRRAAARVTRRLSGSASADGDDFPAYSDWLPAVSPTMTWSWDWQEHVYDQLADVTLGSCPKLLLALPPQHGKTQTVSVPYPLWRMLREPGLRVGVGAYNQHYANRISRWTRKLAARLGCGFGGVNRADEWELDNGSSYVARGVGAGWAGIPVDLGVIDDPFRHRKDADSAVVQEAVYEWYMDDLTPRVQHDGGLVIIHTRWNVGDLIGRILRSEEARDWRYARLPALCETQEERDRENTRLGRPTGEPDPTNRRPGEALCPDRFSAEVLEEKRRTEGVGFETVYQQGETARGGNFFKRDWFAVVDKVPEGKCRRVRYWDLASSRKDDACFTSGVLMALYGSGESSRYYVEDVIRGRWNPAERNDVMRQTAQSDATRPGFERTWFEAPVFDKERAAARAIMAKLSGFPVRGDEVGGQGSKELRAEPLAGAAKAGIVSVVAGPWVAAFLTEIETFPKSTFKDQCDSCSGAFNKLARGGPVLYTATV